MNDETREILEKPFDKKDIGKDYGKNDYVKPHLIIRRLNKAYGQDGWQFELMERIVEHDTIIQFGKLGIKNDGGEMVWKENCGARRCAYLKDRDGKSTDKRLDVGNDYKSAVSNCLKRCAMMHGIALDLYGDPEYDAESAGDSLGEPSDGKDKDKPAEEKQGPKESGSAADGASVDTARTRCMKREAVVLAELKKLGRERTRHRLRTHLLGEGKTNIEDNPEAWDFYKALLDVEENWNKANGSVDPADLEDDERGKERNE